jgi:type II secretory pathway pseudopilin PulG
MKAHRHPSARREGGFTLIVTLVLLLIFAGITAAVFRNSLTSAQVIGNMQWRNEAIAAANDAIDRLLSSADFATNATVVTQLINGDGTAGNPGTPFTYDANGDGNPDIEVRFPVVTQDGVARAGPRCLRAEPIPANQLSPDRPEDVGCFGSSGGSSGLAFEGAGGAGSTILTSTPSLCANTEWTVAVRATDRVTGTSVEVVQGVGVRVPTTAVPACN